MMVLHRKPCLLYFNFHFAYRPGALLYKVVMNVELECKVDNIYLLQWGIQGKKEGLGLGLIISIVDAQICSICIIIVSMKTEKSLLKLICNLSTMNVMFPETCYSTHLPA